MRVRTEIPAAVVLFEAGQAVPRPFYRGIDPDQFAAQAYTGVLVIAEAIRLSGGKGTRADVIAGFQKLKDFPTPLGNFSFLPNRDGSHEPALQQVKDGKFQILK